ncbi:NudC domain-containing protein 1, partial [Trichinella sp. T9]
LFSISNNAKTDRNVIEIEMAFCTKVKFIELRLDQTKFNVGFEGYKLSTGCLRSKSFPTPVPLLSVLPGASQVCYETLKLFAKHNALHHDHWDYEHAVFVLVANSGTIFCVSSLEAALTEFTFTSVAKLEVKLSDMRFNVSVSFPSPDMAIIADGIGSLLVYHTDARYLQREWTLVFTSKFADLIEGSFIIVDSKTQLDASGKRTIDCLLRYLIMAPEGCAKQATSSTYSMLNFPGILWVTLREENENWTIARTRKLLGEGGTIDYCYLSREWDAICLISTCPFQFEHDSLKPVNPHRPFDCIPRPISQIRYIWSQNPERVIFRLDIGLQTPTSKSDVLVIIEKSWILVKSAASSAIYLRGKLFSDVNVENCSFIVVDGEVIVQLEKSTPGLEWKYIVKGDNKGVIHPFFEQMIRPAVLAELMDAIKKNKTESDSSEVDQTPTFSIEEYEDHNASDQEVCFLVWLDGDDHSLISHADIGGHSFLFCTKVEFDKPPRFCLNYDIDGILWQVDNDPRDVNCFKHLESFPAFGYVRAGKPMCKYQSCSADCSYSLLIDSCKRAYVYFRPQKLETSLVNRKTSERVEKVSRQYLITLEENCEIIGFMAHPKALFLLTEYTLHVFYFADDTSK